MAINKVIVNGETKLDLTADTVTIKDVKQGVTFHDATGVLKTGTAVGGSGIEGLYFKDYGLVSDYTDLSFPRIFVGNRAVNEHEWGIFILSDFQGVIDNVYEGSSLSNSISVSGNNRIIGFSVSENGVNNIDITVQEGGC